MHANSHVDAHAKGMEDTHLSITSIRCKRTAQINSFAVRPSSRQPTFTFNMPRPISHLFQTLHLLLKPEFPTQAMRERT